MSLLLFVILLLILFSVVGGLTFTPFLWLLLIVALVLLLVSYRGHV